MNTDSDLIDNPVNDNTQNRSDNQLDQDKDTIQDSEPKIDKNGNRVGQNSVNEDGHDLKLIKSNLISQYHDRWINSFSVAYPMEKAGFFRNYYTYSIDFSISNVKMNVDRRFSDFQALRKSIQKILPCVFIPKVHFKQILVC